MHQGEGGRGSPVVAPCWFRQAVIRMPDEGTAEGMEELGHVGRLRCSCFRLRVDGRRHLPRRQRLDLVDGKDGAQVCCGGRFCPLLGLDGLCLLPALKVESPSRRPLPGVRPAPLCPPPEAVEGTPRVPGAGTA